MKLEPKTRMAMAKCPSCGTACDGATGVTGTAKPKPGDITVCIVCAGVAQYDRDFQLQPFDLALLSRHERAAVDKVRAAIKKLQE